jgi:uncharacterized SAM-binding protein YcdF (DUF218 family)
VAFIVLLAGLWIAGLQWFVDLVPHEGPADPSTTDAIVVLTGGSGRLDEGLRLLAAGLGGELFVSGVAHGVDVATLLKLARRTPEGLDRRISVGYRADNTAGNARETAAWMRSRGFASLRLVTASYHMPRSLFEFRRAMPNIRLVVHPVFPPQFKRDQWWAWPGTATLLGREFTKYLIARVFLSPARPHSEEGAG